jgi:Ring finger domain
MGARGERLVLVGARTFGTLLLLCGIPCWCRIIIPGQPFECSTRFSALGYPLNSEGTIVRLLSLERDPFLCTLNPDSSVANRIRNYTASNEHVPLGLVALDEGRGPCTLEHKVYTAASIGVSFLVMVTSSHVFPTRLRVASDPALLTNLTLLSVTIECRERILEATQFTNMGNDDLLGWRTDVLGPHHDVRVRIDSTVPARQDFLLIPLAFALLLTVWIFFPIRRVAHLFPSSDQVMSPDLLTEDFVSGLCCSPQVAHELISNCEDDEEPPSCPICLDPFQLDSKVTMLPCGHPYHQACVLPWLTKRQSVCPICKFDLMCPPSPPTSIELSHRYRQADSNSSVAALQSPGWGRSGRGPLLRDIRDRLQVTPRPVEAAATVVEAGQFHHELELSQSN